MKTQAQKKQPKMAHVHVYAPFPSDLRFEHCACGMTQRADRISDNPCVVMFGRGPVDDVCITCAHLRPYNKHYATWFECDQRPGHSFHKAQRATWEACARWKLTNVNNLSEKASGGDG